MNEGPIRISLMGTVQSHGTVSPQSSSPIMQILNDEQRVIIELEQAIEGLVHRLAPILSPSGQSAKKSTGQDDVGGSELFRLLRGNIEVLQRQLDILGEIGNALEL